MAKLPKFLKQFFWEVGFAELDSQKNALYIIKRLLDQGDLRAAKWVYQNFPKQEIEKVLTKSRGLSPKTAAFWALVCQIPERRVLCLQRPYRQRLREHWSY